jgi:hypothetical protein
LSEPGTLLAAARERIDRFTAQQAQRAVAGGAVLVDIRPTDQRAASGEIPRRRHRRMGGRRPALAR